MLSQDDKEIIDEFWRLFRSAGISNPLAILENISYLMLLRHMEDAGDERAGEGRAPLRKQLRWSEMMSVEAPRRMAYFKDRVFPLLKTTRENGPDFPAAMRGAVFGISKPSVFNRVTELIQYLFPDDTPPGRYGEIYEGLLAKLYLAGKHDQFRTPRHLIRTIVELLGPESGDWVYDPAAGTGGFLIGAYQWILKQNSPPFFWVADPEGLWQNPAGAKAPPQTVRRGLLEGEHFSAQDVDATMTRIGLTNMLLHGIRRPAFRCLDVLNAPPAYQRKFDVILSDLPKASEHEAQFVAHCRALLKPTGVAALIVSEEFLFNEAAEVARLRRQLLEERILEGVVSLPSGVFMPYSSSRTAVLIINRGGAAERVGFYDVTGDGFTLDKERRPDPENNDLQYLPQAYRMLTRGNPRRERWDSPEAQSFTMRQCFRVNRAQIAGHNFSLMSGTYRPSTPEGGASQSPRQILGQIRRLHEQAGSRLDRIEKMIKEATDA